MSIFKQPRTWIELSSAAFDHNIACYARRLGSTTALAVVVKSNGYGHGLAEIGALCQKNEQVSWLCTAMLSEAVLLRSQGVTKPLLVLSFIDEEPARALEQNIDLVVYDREALRMLNDVGRAHGAPVSVHIKIDTGMSRFGFALSEALAVIREAAMMPFINVRGLCTHFADSSNPDTSFTVMQSESFASLVDAVHAEGIMIPLIHASNSAGVLVPQGKSCSNLVRIGAGAYGLLPPHQWPQPEIPLHSVMTWKTMLTGTRVVKAGATIGYGRFFTASHDMRLGFLPIGYYDGYNAGAIAAHYNGFVLIRGRSAPVIGRLCMNVLMIDLTDVPTAQNGDEVVVMGDYEGIRPYDIGVRTGSGNGRVVTSCINPQIPRVIG